MNKKIFLTGILLPLFFATMVNGQNRVNLRNSNYYQPQDTLCIRVDAVNRVFVSSQSFKNMTLQADSLIALFMDDFEKGRGLDPTLEQSKEVHYIIHSSGKRRMKYANTLDETFNLNKEMYRLDQNLPDYAYVIYYDKTTLTIFLNSPDEVKNLRNVKVNDAIQTAINNKKLARKSNVIEAISDGSGNWDLKKRKGRYLHEFALGGEFGAITFSNQIGALWGLSMDYKFNARESNRKNSIGLSLDFVSAKNTSDYSLPTLMEVQWYRIHWMVSSGNVALGMNYGFLSDPAKNTALKLNGLTWGLMLQVNHIAYGLDFIGGTYLDQRLFTPAFSMKVSY